MTDPWCCCIWCSMDPINKNPIYVSINIPAPAGSIMDNNGYLQLRTSFVFQSDGYHRGGDSGASVTSQAHGATRQQKNSALKNIQSCDLGTKVIRINWGQNVYIYIYTVKLGWGFVKPIARKTNERFQSPRYSLHAAGGWLCMQHPGPRNGAAILEAFPSSGNIAALFLGPVFSPIFGTTKEQTGAARRSWRPGFRPFAGASLPSEMQAAMDTHTHIRIILWGDMAQKLFWISEKRSTFRCRKKPC